MSGQLAITIIGAGPVGALLAATLGQRGLSVDVFERRPDPRLGGAGAGRSINLAVSARGLRALSEVGLDGAVLDCTVPMAGRMVHDPAGGQRLLRYGRDASQQIHSMSRGGLNRLLVEKAEATGRVRFHFSQRLLSWEPDQQLLSFHGEVDNQRRQVAAAVVLGSDGAASALRDAMVRTQGHRVEVAPLDFGYKELHMPPVHGGLGPEGTFAMEPNALHIWPRGRHMLIALPNPDGSFTATLFLPHLADPRFAQTPAFEQLGTVQACDDLFLHDFADAMGPLGDPGWQLAHAPLGHMSTVRVAPWNLHAGLLLGDAAHAIVPFFGQGMNAGFEDCSVLAAALDQLGSSPSSQQWSELFDQFCRDRKPDAEAIADMALENFVEMRDRVADPDFLLQREVEALVQQRLGERYATRYQLVSFSCLPYREAQALGARQAAVLSEACRDKVRLDQVDLDAVTVALASLVPPPA